MILREFDSGTRSFCLVIDIVVDSPTFHMFGLKSHAYDLIVVVEVVV